MTAQEWLDRADALAAAASDGPWFVQLGGWGYYVSDRSEPASADEYVVLDRAIEEDASLAAASRTLVPAMSAALRAVLDLHKPRRVHDTWGICPECSPLGTGIVVGYPCPTVRAITSALDGAS